MHSKVLLHLTSTEWIRSAFNFRIGIACAHPVLREDSKNAVGGLKIRQNFNTFRNAKFKTLNSIVFFSRFTVKF